MSAPFAITGATIFDGINNHHDHAVIIENAQIKSIIPISELPKSLSVSEVDGGILAPGFIDVQVNGGGGVLFNDHPDIDTIATICKAHRQFGTTNLLVTLITDTKDITEQAVAAAIEAQAQNIPGFLGLHLEGPHLSTARKGAHDPALIRKMSSSDLDFVIAAKQHIQNLMITVAPESVSNEQIKKLASSGIIVSLGHSNVTNDIAKGAVAAGATCVTHLFNAMSQLTNREAGIVGTALTEETLFAGLIADGIHVSPTSIKVALSAKQGSGKIMLVTDAMSTIGTDMQSFELNGRKILRQSGRLTLDDGTLAGADFDMSSAIRYMHTEIGLPIDQTIQMATVNPAQCMRLSNGQGTLQVGSPADIVHLNDKLIVSHVWKNGDLCVTH